MKEDVFPQIKKSVTSFMKDESGSISKQSAISIGTLVSAIAASSLMTKDVDAGSITLTSADDGVTAKITASHSHHANHGNHSNHSNHSSS